MLKLFFIIIFFSLILFSQVKVDEIHRKAIILDAHADTPLLLLDYNADLGKKLNFGHIDFPRLREAEVDIQFFAIFVHPEIKDTAKSRALHIINRVMDAINKNQDKVEFASSIDNALSISKKNKTAIMMGLESGHIIDNNLNNIEEFYKKGIRYITLTWINSNKWADAATDTPKWNGLSKEGKAAVKEMNRLGIAIDLSHSSDSTFWDVLRISNAPIIATHSCLRKFNNLQRNINDEMIKALAAKGGVLGINYYPGYLDSNFKKAYNKLRDKLKSETDNIKLHFKGKDKEYSKIIDSLNLVYEKMYPVVNADKVVEEIDYVVKLAGINCVGLGSDFDGVSFLPKGLEDVTKIKFITKQLIKKGYNDTDIYKIMGGNFIRVFNEIDKAKFNNK